LANGWRSDSLRAPIRRGKTWLEDCRSRQPTNNAPRLRRLPAHRGEADRSRALLLTLSDWTSPRIAAAFGVRDDTVRLWRSDFADGGVEPLTASVAPGPAPVKSETALRVVSRLSTVAFRRRADGHGATNAKTRVRSFVMRSIRRQRFLGPQSQAARLR
jgi:Homeodomain-like domain